MYHAAVWATCLYTFGMAPSVRLKPVLLASLCVFACGLVVWWIGAAFYQAHRMAQESAQLALLAEAAQKLDTYHKEHGEYPTSLD